MSVTYDNAVRNLPDCLRLDRITAVKRDIYRSMVILPLDKNGGKPVLLCKRLYAQLLIEQYSDEKQFSVIADCQSPAQATATAMQLIYQNAVQYRIAPHIRMGKRYAPPSSFVSMNNKSQHCVHANSLFLFPPPHQAVCTKNRPMPEPLDHRRRELHVYAGNAEYGWYHTLGGTGQQTS